MIPHAKNLPKTKQAVKRLGTEEYIGSRISSAVDNGFSSTKMWIQPGEFDAATHLLQERGYKYEVLQTEDRGSTQLLVSW